MLKIRLQRVGRVNNPSFRLVVTDSKNATKSGKYLEVLGHFDYRSKAGKTDTADNHLEAEKIQKWIANGAQLTPSVHNLLLSKGIIKGKKINVLPRKSPPKKEEAPKETKDATAGAAPAGAPTAETAPSEAPAATEAAVAEPAKA